MTWLGFRFLFRYRHQHFLSTNSSSDANGRAHGQINFRVDISCVLIHMSAWQWFLLAPAVANSRCSEKHLDTFVLYVCTNPAPTPVQIHQYSTPYVGNKRLLFAQLAFSYLGNYVSQTIFRVTFPAFLVFLRNSDFSSVTYMYGHSSTYLVVLLYCVQ